MSSYNTHICSNIQMSVSLAMATVVICYTRTN